MKTTLELIIPYDPCQEAKTWASYNPDPSMAWETCPNPLWLAWIARKLRVDGKLRALTACKCARAVLHLIPEKGDVLRKTIVTVEAFLRGEASEEDVRQMKISIHNMSCGFNRKLPYNHVHYALWAIDAAAVVAVDPYELNSSMLNSYTVVHDATYAAEDAGMDLKVIADAVRSVLTWDVMSQYI